MGACRSTKYRPIGAKHTVSGTFGQQYNSNDAYAGGAAFDQNGNSVPLPVDLVFSEGLHAVPEPSSISMFGIGALGLLGYSRRRRQTAAAA